MEANSRFSVTQPPEPEPYKLEHLQHRETVTYASAMLQALFSVPMFVSAVAAGKCAVANALHTIFDNASNDRPGDEVNVLDRAFQGLGIWDAGFMLGEQVPQDAIEFLIHLLDELRSQDEQCAQLFDWEVTSTLTPTDGAPRVRSDGMTLATIENQPESVESVTRRLEQGLCSVEDIQDFGQRTTERSTLPQVL